MSLNNGEKLNDGVTHHGGLQLLKAVAMGTRPLE